MGTDEELAEAKKSLMENCADMYIALMAAIAFYHLDTNEMDKRVENAKRIGIRVTKIKDNPIDKKIFLICPVRNATEEQRKWIENFVAQKIGGSI